MAAKTTRPNVARLIVPKIATAVVCKCSLKIQVATNTAANAKATRFPHQFQS